jgi:uncharacterized membrane protein YeaQ/YmgE (transglycosylase-associated protein family)
MPVVFLLLLLLVVGGLIWVTASLVHLVLFLFMAGVIGALADAIVPGRLPWGWLGAVVAGLVGSWLGSLLIGHVGPSLFGINILSAFVGALVLVFGLTAVGKLQASK